MTVEPGIDPALRTLYEQSYDGTSAWRESGAGEKAANIVRLCSSVPHATVLDIGPGEGAGLELGVN